MNDNNISQERPKFPLEKEHKANPHYRKAILKAIEELHDFQSRSNIDAIRRHAQASMGGPDFPWNDLIFLKTLKATVQDGDVEKQQLTKLAGLSAEFKRKRANSLTAVKEQRELNQQQQQQQQQHQMQYEGFFFQPVVAVAPPLSPSAVPPHPVDPTLHDDVPKRKTEHVKNKITPRKLQTTRVFVNPMDTH